MMKAYNAADALLTPNLTASRRDRTAVIDDRGRYSYAELAVRVDRFANLLRERGLDNGQRVLLCLEDGVDFPTCFLGAMRAGAIPVPLNTLLTSDDYAYIAADSAAEALVVSAPLLGKWRALAAPTTRFVAGDRDAANGLERALAAAATTSTSTLADRDAPAFWLYSSGTTGKPKGVVHRHGALEFTAGSYARQVLELDAGDIVFSAAKLFFAYGLGNALTFPLAVGATTVLTAARPTPDVVNDVLRRHRPTVFCGVPTLYAMLLADTALAPRDRLRICISAGEALPEAILSRWQAAMGMPILDGIGSTELLHIFVSNRPDDVAPGSSGRPVTGYQVRLVDETGRPVEDDEIGNLEVHGGSAALGYWQLPELTRSTFHDGWVRTGDKYLRRPSGHLVYCGRRDDLLKVGGIYVSPMEVENVLLEHAAVLEAAVVGARDADDLVKPKAFVVVRQPSAAGVAQQLVEHVCQRLAAYKRPRWVEIVEELPKTATGKIQRFKLR